MRIHPNFEYGDTADGHERSGKRQSDRPEQRSLERVEKHPEQDAGKGEQQCIRNLHDEEDSGDGSPAPW